MGRNDFVWFILWDDKSCEKYLEWYLEGWWGGWGVYGIGVKDVGDEEWKIGWIVCLFVDIDCFCLVVCIFLIFRNDEFWSI